MNTLDRLRQSKAAERRVNTGIYAVAIGAAGLYAFNALGVETSDNKSANCTVEYPAGSNLTQFAYDYLGASNDREAMNVATEVATDNGYNDPSSTQPGNLELTDEYCQVVVESGGEITPITPED